MNITFNSVTPDQFFQNLSQADGRFLYSYNKSFEINRFRGGRFEIREASKGNFNPFKMKQDDVQKLYTAKNLKALFEANAKRIVTKTELGVDVAQITRVLERYKATFEKSTTDPDKKNAIQHAFQGAIQSLNQAKNEHIRRGVSHIGKTQWEPGDFIEKLAKGWITGRPNFKFHLNLEENGNVTPYTSRKLFWIEKLLYGKATSSLEKKAMMQNLELFIKHWIPYIQGGRFNATAIADNIERLAGRMTHNMTSGEKAEIETLVGNLKTRLQEVQVQIDKDRAKDPFWNIWWGVKWTALAPIRLTKWVAWDNLGYPLAKVSATGLYYSGAWAVSPLAPTAKRVHESALIGYNGIKTVASYPAALAKGTYTNVIAPTVEVTSLIAKGVIALGKLPIQTLNQMRQVTA